MRKIALTIIFIAGSLAFLSSCREKSPSEKIEDGIEEVGEGIEDAVD